MKVLILQRVHSDASGTYGVLKEEGWPPMCLTLELPWRDNARNISCIPSGEYLVQRVVRIHLGECWEILEVPNRDGILIHKANFTSELRGCIAVGEEFHETLDPKAEKVVTSVQSSGRAFSELMRKLIGETQFKLVIQ